MKGQEHYVVDTNVLIAASTGDSQYPKDIDATTEDPSLRLKIFCWLDEFRASSSRLVFDDVGKILKEYKNRLDYQDFGIQVVIHKLSTSAVDSVSVEYDANGHGCLPDTLAPTIHDREDRKMVAACLAALVTHGPCLIAFARDSDWVGWEEALHQLKDPTGCPPGVLATTGCGSQWPAAAVPETGLGGGSRPL